MSDLNTYILVVPDKEVAEVSGIGSLDSEMKESEAAGSFSVLSSISAGVFFCLYLLKLSISICLHKNVARPANLTILTYECDSRHKCVHFLQI